MRFEDADRTTVTYAEYHRQAIVDPFLLAETKPGELFWVFVVPNLVSGFHHAFDIEAAQEEPAEERVYSRFDDDDGCSGSWCDGH